VIQAAKSRQEPNGLLAVAWLIAAFGRAQTMSASPLRSSTFRSTVLRGSASRRDVDVQRAHDPRQRRVPADPQRSDRSSRRRVAVHYRVVSRPHDVRRCQIGQPVDTANTICDDVLRFLFLRNGARPSRATSSRFADDDGAK
jgi:hypothetical protein